MFVCFVCFYFVAVDFVFIFVGLFFVVCFFKFVFFFIFILRAAFISLWVGLGLIFCWSENQISYFGVACKYLSMGMESAVIKELFIIVHIF